jgi:YHS domain-containing protein
MTKDPVCGMAVDEKDSKIKSEYRGRMYTFCSQGCKISFDEEPEKYLKEGNE